jgi:ubiquinone/menaquinone biosynthesis C-methylase UbiE
VLEVACGAGAALDYLAQDAAHVVGMDYTSSVLSSARQHSQVALVQGDAQTLPFAGASFDLILCFEAIYYLEDYRRFLAECQRILIPGGKLLICQSNPDWPDFVAGALTTHYPSLPELTTALTQASFGDLQSYGTLPITAASSSQQLINKARRWVIQSGLLPLLGPLKPLLQRLSYRQLHPLPATIDSQWVATWQGNLTLTSLSPHERDVVHRVVMVEAAK